MICHVSKTTRNRLLALACLLVFLALGALFYVNWVVQRPFAVILFLADNLTVSSLTPARHYAGGADHRLEIEKFPHLAVLSSHANDFAVADSASASVPFARGSKANNGSLAPARPGAPWLLELARKSGRATGLVSNASITDAAAAAFYADTPDPLDYPLIARQLLESFRADVFLGGGAADFLPVASGGRRTDERDLLSEAVKSGVDVVRSEPELEALPSWRAPKTVGLFSMGNLHFADELVGGAGQPDLASLVRQAIRLLQYNPRGYLLVVDAGLAGKSAAQNEGERTLREILALDQAVAEALRYAGKDALVVVAGKRSVGGLRLNGFPFRNDKGAAILGINPQGVPSITWSTGPESGTHTGTQGPVSSEPAASRRAAGIETAEDLLAVGQGPGTEQLSGFRDNTLVFEILREAL